MAEKPLFVRIYEMQKLRRRRILRLSAIALVICSATYAIVLFHGLKQAVQAIPILLGVTIERLERGVVHALMARVCLVDARPTFEPQCDAAPFPN